MPCSRSVGTFASAPGWRCGAPTAMMRILPASRELVRAARALHADVEMAAGDLKRRVGAGVEHDRFHFGRVGAGLPREHRDGNVQRIAGGGRETERERGRIFLQPLDDIARGLDRRIGAHEVDLVLVEQFDDRREVAGRDRAAARGDRREPARRREAEIVGLAGCVLR